MEKILNFIRFMLNAFINIVVLVGLTIVILWLVWDISPQQTITKTAYFFSQSWAIVTGRRPDESTKHVVTTEQLEDSANHIKYYSE